MLYFYIENRVVDFSMECLLVLKNEPLGLELSFKERKTKFFYFLTAIQLLNKKYLLLGSTPRVIIGSQTPRNPLSRFGPGFTWLSIQFDRVVRIILQ